MGQGFATNYFKTETPAEKYNSKNIQDVYDRGFRNLRLRCRADLYDTPYEADDADFKEFLDELESVSCKFFFSQFKKLQLGLQFKKLKINFLLFCTGASQTREKLLRIQFYINFCPLFLRHLGCVHTRWFP